MGKVMNPTDLYICQAKNATDSKDFTDSNIGCMGGPPGLD
jgi:hypothetical protein